MTQLILKNDISPLQLGALLQLLQTWNIEAETVPAVAGEKDKVPVGSCLTETDLFKRLGLDESDFDDDDLDPIDPNDPLAGIRGMWEDYNINARDLRRGILPDEAYSTIDAESSPAQRNVAYHIEEPVAAVAEPSAPYSPTAGTQDKEEA